jgi:preprotein translocase subunit SecG
MTHLILASASFGQVILTIALVMVALLLIGLILLQKNRGSGLSGAFGGVGGHTAFGTKTGDFLTWVTVSLAAFFLILSVVANFVFDRSATAAVNPPAAAESSAPVSPPIKSIPISSLKTQPAPTNVSITPVAGTAPTTTVLPVSAQPVSTTPPAPAPTTQPSH